MGYLQNFVMPSRRNQSRELASASSETSNHTKNEAYRHPQEKLNLTRRAGQNIRKASRGRGFDSKAEGPTGGDMENADGSSKRNRVFLRSEVEETRTPRPKCKRFVVDNEQPKRFGNVKIENCGSQVVLRQSIQFPTHDLVQEDILMTLTSWLPKVKCQRQALRS